MDRNVGVAMPDWAWLAAILAAFVTANRAHLMVLLLALRGRVTEAESMRLVADFERKLPRSGRVLTYLFRLLLRRYDH